MSRYREEELSGWGQYPRAGCRVYRPERVAELRELLASAPAGGVVPRGLGRAYADAALNAGGAVVSQLRLGRLLGFDASSGVLECEGGASLGDIAELLLPRGWFLPVVPGTRHVTLGGAIAADIHGKNHHRDGSFGAWVESFDLATPAAGTLRCSAAEEPALFHATQGAMGLTGAIERARVRLLPVESGWMRVDRARTRDLAETLARFAERDAGHRYSVAWIDALAGGRAAGRGVVMHADHAAAAEVAGERWPRPGGGGLPLPPFLPPGLLNRFSVGAFNRLYRLAQRPRERALEPLARWFWPLDAVRGWARLYGRRGFVQHQCVLPPGAEGALAALLARAAGSGRASFLAVLKRFGAAGGGPLSFPTPGWTLALDFPARRDTLELARELNALVADAGGRVYLAKDAVLDAPTFARMYPRAGELAAVRARVDPQGVLTSSLARRVGLV